MENKIIDLLPRRTINTPTFLETCALDADYKAMEEHLVNNPVWQKDLNKCLLRGLRIVKRKEKPLSHVAKALTILLRSGAKWNSDALLYYQKTPLHIICESQGDHHELLDLMIKSTQLGIINAQDTDKRTALIHAVRHSNINCLKSLITNGGDVNISDDTNYYLAPGAPPQASIAIIEAIEMLGSGIKYTSVNEEIMDLLLDQYPIDSYMSLLLCAIDCGNLYCTKKLIERGARINVLDHEQRYVWSRMAELGSVEFLKCLLNHGIDKDTTDQKDFCVLWYVCESGNLEAVRYLLDLGVVIPNCTSELYETQCGQCEEKILTIEDHDWTDQGNPDPCIRAICNNSLQIVKLLDKHGCQSCKTFSALRHAVLYNRVDVTKYLLNNYTYPLNIQYILESDRNRYVRILLTEIECKRTLSRTAVIIKLLLDHGADPAKQMCSLTSGNNALMTAITQEYLEVLAQFIRSGVNINFRSYAHPYKNALPFEASVLHGVYSAAKMLLLSGCSCGVFSLNNNHELKDNLTPEVEELMKEWKLLENEVTPLQQRSRSVILNHLSPQAHIKIKKLPLPGLLIKFLAISEIDDIADEVI